MAGLLPKDSLHSLVAKADAAFAIGRWVRAADLHTRAALQASALYPHDSLVTSKLQFHAAGALQGQSNQPGLSVTDQRALHEAAWALVPEGMEVVTRRHASDTLGFNKCRPDEVQYATRHVSSLVPAEVEAARSARVLAAFATSNSSWFGVTVAIRLARLCLYRLHCRFFGIPLPPLAAPDLGIAEQFVFRALDYFALTRAVKIPLQGETPFVYCVQRLLALTAMEPSFRAALEARWTSPDVVASLRMRGEIYGGAAIVNHVRAARRAAQRAYVAEHGLLVCALPGCDKMELTVREFKVCSACRAVAYCSVEHGALHWARGHKHECKYLKAAGAKPARAA